MQCDPSLGAAGVECIPLWSPPTADRDVQRERFFEWPLAAAIVLGFAGDREARHATEALRDRAREEGSRIAIVLEDADLAGRSSPAMAGVRDAANRARAIAERDPRVDTRALDILAREPPSGARLIPWLRLDAEEVMVVPKLGSLADVDGFAREVERDAASLGPDGPVQWVRRPDPIR